MISFIIPTYNSEKTIARAIRSIQFQRLQKEIIVCDDGSMDDTREICERLGVNLFIEGGKNSGGPNRGRNEGLFYMNGEYFCFVDHDDELITGSMQPLLEQASVTPIVFGDYMYDNGKKQYLVGNGRSIYYEKNQLFLKFLKQDKSKFCLPMVTGTLISARFKEIKFEEIFGMLDLDYMLRITENQLAVKIGKPVFVRHVHSDNLSLKQHTRNIMYYGSCMFLENYYKKYPKETTEGLRKLAGTKARYHYKKGQMEFARFFFKRSKLNLKNILYYLTTFIGGKWVKKHFRISGT